MSKLKDLTGKKFGGLTVLEFTGRNKEGRAVWKCICDCGIKKTIRRDSLISGATTSCGCYQREVIQKTMSSDLIGHVFSRLIVKEKTGLRSPNGCIKWLCVCDCGNVCFVSTTCLRNGDTKSCGCLQIEKVRIQGFKNAKNGTGITPEHEAFRRRIAYKEWRQIVFERDDFICAKCGLCGGTINSHHIVSFSVNEELRLRVDNGMTLCEKCHREFHSEYGKKQYDSMNLSKFLN